MTRAQENVMFFGCGFIARCVITYSLIQLDNRKAELAQLKKELDALKATIK